jgi:hypothetical protein
VALWGAGLGVAAAPAARAEVFQLANGGRIEGEWLNRDDPHPQQYRIQLPSGGTVTLSAAQVKEVVKVSPDEAEYAKIRGQYPDTAAGQWKLAEWCEAHHLEAQRKTHLLRVVELDPNNAEAHHALHQSFINGQWQTQQEAMDKDGRRLYHGRYLTAQEIEVAEQKRKVELADKEWQWKLKMWRHWLGNTKNGKKEQEARDNIAGITDPAAVTALGKALKNDSDTSVRLLYIEVLSKIDSPMAPRVLAQTSMLDDEAEVRLSCLECLAKMKHDDVVPYYIGQLHSKNNEMVNRAGVALSYMKEPTSIRPLIDALITVHEFKVTTGNPNGGMSTAFGKGANGQIGPGMGGPGLSVGSSTHTFKKSLQNPGVLDALVVLTKQNFGFEVAAWHAWYNAQKQSDGVTGTRRD